LEIIIGAVTALFTLLAAWIKYRSATKSKSMDREPPENDLAARIRENVRNTPHVHGFGSAGSGVAPIAVGVLTAMGVDHFLHHSDHHAGVDDPSLPATDLDPGVGLDSII
jgi:hypothetical protein